MPVSVVGLYTPTRSPLTVQSVTVLRTKVPSARTWDSKLGLATAPATSRGYVEQTVVGCGVGLVVGASVGAGVVGAGLGDGEGRLVGAADGAVVGSPVGAGDGDAVGWSVGLVVGVEVGLSVGDVVGEPDGARVGVAVGLGVGEVVGVPVGAGDGEVVGAKVLIPNTSRQTSGASKRRFVSKRTCAAMPYMRTMSRRPTRWFGGRTLTRDVEKLPNVGGLPFTSEAKRKSEAALNVPLPSASAHSCTT